MWISCRYAANFANKNFSFNFHEVIYFFFGGVMKLSRQKNFNWIGQFILIFNFPQFNYTIGWASVPIKDL